MNITRGKSIKFIYLFVFLSGASALMYQIVWFRSLSLIFGGTNLAVTTTVAAFMLGLALGNWGASRTLHRVHNLLGFYGLLELGIGLSALLFMFLVKVYPILYAPLARLAPDSPFYMTIIRIFFGLLAMIIPTTLMGATLPVLVSFSTNHIRMVGRYISYLYGFNTLGAVIGATLVGYYLLKFVPLSGVTSAAVAINLFIAAACYIFRNAVDRQNKVIAEPEIAVREKGTGRDAYSDVPLLSYRLALVAIGVSGFCALAYEVLWTRVLILFLDGSVYSFTTVLAAFLLGISLGGVSCTFLFDKFLKRFDQKKIHVKPFIIWFAIAQLFIGLGIFGAMNSIFNIPSYVIRLHKIFYIMTNQIFSARLFGNFIFSFLFLLVPGFFMGLSIPLATKINAIYRNSTGKAAGEVLAVNTIGSILGAALAGYLMVFLFGIERSMQMFVTLNISMGFVLLASLRNNKLIIGFVSAAAAGALLFLTVKSDRFKSWDRRYLASYTSNQAGLFAGGKEAIDQRLSSKELLYYGEGAEAIVSSVRDRSSKLMSFTINGRVEASTLIEDVQLMFLLGHVPVLLHENPKNVLVVGAGSGMTLGAISVYPEVDNIVLTEIEPKVLGVARTFKAWNHNVLENKKVKFVFNDGRNYLLTTDQLFDVITADPIHPAWRGSGYLYTDEYFKLAASRLAPGGIVSHWLPLYQMSVDDVKSTVRTFTNNFEYTMLWCSLTDVALFGSNKPILIDADKISRSVSIPEVAYDLEFCNMGPAEDLFTYFLMGTENAREFSKGAVLNTDDNVFLEFSSPLNIGGMPTELSSMKSLLDFQENIEPFMLPLKDDSAQMKRKAKWNARQQFSELVKKAHIMELAIRSRMPYYDDHEQQRIRRELRDLPDLGLWKILKISLGMEKKHRNSSQ